MFKISNCITIACLALGVAFSQNAAKPPSFNVASVKQNLTAPGASRATTIETDTSVTYTRTTLLRLMMRAYNVKYFQVSGPAWFTTAYYDIVAKLPEDATKEQIPVMLQQLLQTRFGIKCHRESRDTAVYALTAPGGALKFKPCKAEECQREFLAHARDGSTQLHANTFGQLAVQLSSVTDRPVQDVTGLSGTFNITVPEFMSADFAPGDDDAGSKLPSVFTAIQSLGLKLQSQRAPVEYIVVDSAERIPTAN